MIFVDRATGSAAIAPQLEEVGLPIYRNDDDSLPAVDFADVEFTGRGVRGEPQLIGIELKRLSELTGDWDRFAGHQVPKMLAQYTHRYLIYEGEWQQNRKGNLIKRTGRMSFSALHGQPSASALRKKLITLEMCGGFHVIHVPASGRNGQWSQETVRTLVDLYHWWTDDDFDEHKSHIVNYQPHGLIPLNDYERAFAAWPGLSNVRARVVAKRFNNSIRLAASSPVRDWAEIAVPGEDGKVRRLGEKAAMKLVAFVKGEK